VVTHDIPIRGEHPLEGPVSAVANASMLVVGQSDLREALRRMDEALTGPAA